MCSAKKKKKKKKNSRTQVRRGLRLFGLVRKKAACTSSTVNKGGLLCNILKADLCTTNLMFSGWNTLA
jgi:hypothetical protein